ncbi:hypothetical protein ACFWSF_05005 [Streptomyces sp. NPDC058611]
MRTPLVDRSGTAVAAPYGGSPGGAPPGRIGAQRHFRERPFAVVPVG